MIKNAKQLAVSKAERAKFAEAVVQLEGEIANAAEADPFASAYLAMMRADIERLDKQIADYAEVVAGKFEPSTISGIETIGEDLVKARIAANLTQEKLAHLVKCKPQQIQRYESSEYASASLSRLLEIAGVLQAALMSSRLVAPRRR